MFELKKVFKHTVEREENGFFNSVFYSMKERNTSSHFSNI